MNDIIETIEYKNYNIQLCYDTFPDDPRKFNENLGFMACFHKRYNLGDKHNFSEPHAYSYCPLCLFNITMLFAPSLNQRIAHGLS